ncbi:MAG: type II toxin-antitoxin system HicA family toxin [Candidatus Paceibacterota bacterium]
MRKTDLIKYLQKYGCVFVREGAKHSVFFNPLLKRISTIPRHTEINKHLAEKICKDLGVQIDFKKRKK